MIINSSYDACAVIEGFSDSEPSLDQTLEAWAYLIKTGDCWKLQGSYGRGATNLIDGGVISKDGNTINKSCLSEN